MSLKIVHLKLRSWRAPGKNITKTQSKKKGDKLVQTPRNYYILTPSKSSDLPFKTPLSASSPGKAYRMIKK